MSQQTKSNVIFGIILVIIIFSTILVTYVAIKNHKSSFQEITEKNYFAFDDVDYADTVDARKKYNVNPITVDLKGDNVSISGLKNKEVEKKVNEKLKNLDNSSNNYCNVDFNVSNVLSVTCNNDYVTVNLKNGEDIKLEEVFNVSTDLKAIMREAIYDSVCTFLDCRIDYIIESVPNPVENVMSAIYKKIQKKDYTFYLRSNYLTIKSKIYDEDYNNLNYVYINLYKYKDNITIYDRFADDSEEIYETPSNESCYPIGCDFNAKWYDYSNEFEFINDKSFLAYAFANSTDSYLNKSFVLTKRNDLDLKKLNKDFLSIIFDKEKKIERVKNYSYVTINSQVYRSTYDYDIVTYNGDIKNYSKDEFENVILGYATLVGSNIIKDNLYGISILKNGKFLDFETDSGKIFVDFENDLKKYLQENKERLGISDILGNTSIETSRISDIIRNVKVQIDKDNGVVYMISVINDSKNIEDGFYPFVTFKDVIPMDNFKLREA